jgi:hypothetical protein
MKISGDEPSLHKRAVSELRDAHGTVRLREQGRTD